MVKRGVHILIVLVTWLVGCRDLKTGNKTNESYKSMNRAFQLLDLSVTDLVTKQKDARAYEVLDSFISSNKGNKNNFLCSRGYERKSILMYYNFDYELCINYSDSALLFIYRISNQSDTTIYRLLRIYTNLAEYHLVLAERLIEGKNNKSVEGHLYNAYNYMDSVRGCLKNLSQDFKNSKKDNLVLIEGTNLKNMILYYMLKNKLFPTFIFQDSVKNAQREMDTFFIKYTKDDVQGIKNDYLLMLAKEKNNIMSSTIAKKYLDSVFINESSFVNNYYMMKMAYENVIISMQKNKRKINIDSIRSVFSDNEVYYAEKYKKEVAEKKLFKKEKELNNANNNLYYALFFVVIIGIYTFYLAQKRKYLNKLLEKEKQEVQQLNQSLNKEKQAVNDKNKELEMEKKRIDNANRVQHTFIKIITHDTKGRFSVFKNLLLDYIKENENEENADIFSLLNKHILSLQNTFDHLLTWAKNQKDIELKVAVNISEVNINQLFGNLKQLQMDADSRNMNLVFTSTILTIKTDSNILQFILRNLISNAIKHSNGKLVEVKVYKENDGEENEKIIFEVTDDGKGIENTTGIFDIEKERHKEIGSGLGLITIKELIYSLEGTIWVKSEVGKGSTFFISIPAQLTNYR